MERLKKEKTVCKKRMTKVFFCFSLGVISVANGLSVPSWNSIEKSLGSSFGETRPVEIDSALDPSTPNYSSEHPTLFR